MEDLAVGIDLGTTNSCVCIYWKEKYEVVQNGFTSNTTPSYVTFDEDGILVGEASRNNSFEYPQKTVFGIKRIIGRHFDDAEVQRHRERWPFSIVSDRGFPVIRVQEGEAKTYTPAEVSSHVLRHLRQDVKNYTSVNFSKVVITVPASFTDPQRRATLEAGKLAGLEVIGMVNEPTAAALAYNLQKLDGEQVILIFDFGGGTLDVAILKVINGTRFETLAMAANMQLGGEDFDEKLLERFVAGFKENNGGIDLKKSPAAVAALRLCCDTAKKSLSTLNGVAHVVVSRIHEDKSLRTIVTRAEFEALCEEVFSGILKPVEQALAQARLSKDEINHVVLVGGSSRIPKVQEILQNFFPSHILHKDINGDEAIAKGAAIYARNFDVQSGNPDHRADGTFVGCARL